MTRRRSNTIGNKIKEQETQITAIDYHDTNQHTINVIFRRTNKIPRNLQIPSQLTTHKLKALVDKEFYISEDNQILFWRGKRIDSNKFSSCETLILSQGDIINVHNKQIISRSSAEICFQFLNSDFIKYRQLTTTVSPQQTIQNCFSNKFILKSQDIKNCVCVQSGRFIDISKNFEQEAIQDQSIILILFNQVNLSFLPILQQREIKLLQSKSKGQKRASLSAIDGQENSNFKKKQKIFSCKSIIIPESLELIWEEDTSDEHEYKNLAKTFLMKKNETVNKNKYKNNKIDQNDSKSDTSSSDKSINFQISHQQPSDFIFSQNEDVQKGENKDSPKSGQLCSNKFCQQNKFYSEQELELNKLSLNYSPHLLVENMRDVSILNQEIFLPTLFVNTSKMKL